jgi:hypothetical protein
MYHPVCINYGRPPPARWKGLLPLALEGEGRGEGDAQISGGLKARYRILHLIRESHRH